MTFSQARALGLSAENAALLAAAPRLVAMLAEIVDTPDDSGELPIVLYVPPEVVRRAQELLGQVRGRAGT